MSFSINCLEITDPKIEQHRNIYKNLCINTADRRFFFNDYYKHNQKGNLIRNEHHSIDKNFFGKNINIQAIVGKNGSGKSSLMDLMYMAINNFAFMFVRDLKREKAEPLYFVKDLFVNLYFSDSENEFKLLCKNEEVSFFSKKKGAWNKIIETNWNEKNPFLKRTENEFKDDFIKNLKNFFYTIVSNYSFQSFISSNFESLTYANLEEKESERPKERRWINSIFHKNDSYISPIVLNPYRGDGIVDLNNELELSKERLIALAIYSKKHNESFDIKYFLDSHDDIVFQYKEEIAENKLGNFFKRLNESLPKYRNRFEWEKIEKKLQGLRAEKNNEIENFTRFFLINIRDSEWKIDRFLRSLINSCFSEERTERYSSVKEELIEDFTHLVRNIYKRYPYNLAEEKKNYDLDKINDYKKYKRLLDAFVDTIKSICLKEKKITSLTNTIREVFSLSEEKYQESPIKLLVDEIIYPLLEEKLFTYKFEWYYEQFQYHKKGIETSKKLVEEIINDETNILSHLIKAFGLKFKSGSSKIRCCCLLLLFDKIEKIVETYPRYSRYKRNFYKLLLNKIDDFDSIKKDLDDFDSLIEVLKKDGSHVTIKLWQYVNFLKLSDDSVKKICSPKSTTYSEYKNFGLISSKKSELDQIMDTLPPAFCKSDIFLSYRIDCKKVDKVSYRKLSSGELQFMQTLAIHIYHIRNLLSIPDTKIKYNKINLIFDELELCFHPEMQRQFVNILVRMLTSLFFKKENGPEFNIFILTHSPFILSDIPKGQILYMNEGKMDESVGLKSYAGNIAEMFYDSFFMKSTIGSFAEKKIQEFINQLEQGTIEKRDAQLIVNMIGDEFLKKLLQDKVNRCLQ